MSSQGYATRAVKDLIDALSDTDEPIEIFCVHDADAFGTTIFESLQEATRARPRRTVEITNLGLERAEAEAMGLECEPLEPSRKTKSTAAYVSQEDHDWYQTNRYELNVMTSPQFIEWLDAKMVEHAKGKVIPPTDVMSERLEKALHASVYEEEFSRLVAEANIAAIAAVQAERRVSTLRPSMSEVDLEAHVRTELLAEPEGTWSSAIDSLASSFANETEST